MLPTLDEYAENIRTIIRLGREQGVQVVFMTQPSLWDDTPYWRGIRESYYWTESDSTMISAATTWRLLEVFNHELISICRREGVPCLDLASLVPHSSRYFYDGMHFNEAGAALVAELLADFLVEQGLIRVR
jgi:lysophospholipase L1-like esterase